VISERSKDPEQKSFQRSLNRLLDPSQLEDMERKRKANLLHQVSFQYVLFFNWNIFVYVLIERYSSTDSRKTAFAKDGSRRTISR
jgi:hypothetical protein